MTADDPYTPPEAELDLASDGEAELAGRGARLGAAIIDGLLIFLALLPLTYLLGYWDPATAAQQSLTELLAMNLLGIVAFLLLHGYLIATRGQTIGKYLVGLRMVSIHTGKILPLPKIFALRYLPISIISMVPLIGPLFSLVDVLFIFRSDRRCIHDLIAGTRVVKAS